MLLRSWIWIFNLGTGQLWVIWIRYCEWFWASCCEWSWIPPCAWLGGVWGEWVQLHELGWTSSALLGWAHLEKWLLCMIKNFPHLSPLQVATCGLGNTADPRGLYGPSSRARTILKLFLEKNLKFLPHALQVGPCIQDELRGRTSGTVDPRGVTLRT